MFFQNFNILHSFVTRSFKYSFIVSSILLLSFFQNQSNALNSKSLFRKYRNNTTTKLYGSFGTTLVSGMYTEGINNLDNVGFAGAFGLNFDLGIQSEFFYKDKNLFLALEIPQVHGFGRYYNGIQVANGSDITRAGYQGIFGLNFKFGRIFNLSKKRSVPNFLHENFSKVGIYSIVGFKFTDIRPSFYTDVVFYGGSLGIGSYLQFKKCPNLRVFGEVEYAFLPGGQYGSIGQVMDVIGPEYYGALLFKFGITYAAIV